jgi:hypothetical protein
MDQAERVIKESFLPLVARADVLTIPFEHCIVGAQLTLGISEAVVDAEISDVAGTVRNVPYLSELREGQPGDGRPDI